MRPPHRIFRLALLALLALAVVAGPVRAPAQTSDLGDIIDRNTELLAEATALVRTTNSIKARAALEAARKLHELSMSEYSMGNRLMAGRTARDAREAILRAIAIARREAKLEDGAARAIERAALRLEQARTDLNEYGGRDDTAARKLIEEAQDQLQRAQNNMQEHMFEVALQLAGASSDMSARAIRMLRRDVVTPELVRRELERTDQILARLDPRERPHGTPQGVYEDARRLQDRAVASARAENWAMALDQTRRARDMALRMLKAPGPGDADDEDALRALDFTDEVLERAAQIAREDGLDDVLRGIGDATRTQEQARDALRRGRPDTALQMTMRARDMARDALSSTRKPINREVAGAALDRTDEMIARLRAELGDQPDDPARAILERAMERQAEARKAFEAGEFRKALALTRVARGIAARAAGAPPDDDE